MSDYGQPPGFGPPYGGGFGPPPLPAGPPRTDALGVVALVGGLLALVGAIANLVSGFCGVFCALCTIGGALIGLVVAIPAIIGIVCGILGYSRTTRQPEVYTGKGLALAGAITGGVAILLTIATVVGPWFGLGCLSATAPHRPPADPFDPIAIDAGALGLPADPLPLPPPPPFPTGGACARAGTCCAAYLTAMGGEAPVNSCDRIAEDYASVPEALCLDLLRGYRDELSASGRTIPPECVSEPSE